MSGQENPASTSQALAKLIAATTEAALTQAYQLGFSDGFQAGNLTGYVTGVNAMVPAVSDGLRHGSSECGKALQSLKTMGATPTEVGEKKD
jgi:flagellar biosynthesis/type III secretory pathway protein FliH